MPRSPEVPVPRHAHGPGLAEGLHLDSLLDQVRSARNHMRGLSLPDAWAHGMDDSLSSALDTSVLSPTAAASRIRSLARELELLAEDLHERADELSPLDFH
ncbi:hypothetical protein [Lentzea roselyniae]